MRYPLPLGLAALVFATSAANVLQLAGVPLGGRSGVTFACTAILILGLPHGALDLELLRREGRPRRMILLIALYLACAVATWGVWRVAPVLALSLFLVIAIVHFAEDWDACGSSFLAAALAAALLCAPALFHRTALRALFIALTGRVEGGVVAEVLLLIAPTALLGALTGIAALALANRRELAAVAGVSLVGLVVLPPTLAFALYFGLAHSPRHFSATLRAFSRVRVAQWAPIVVPTTLAALAIGTVLYRIAPGGAAPTRLAGATFLLLSVLTVPHMLAPQVLRLYARRGRGVADGPGLTPV